MSIMKITRDLKLFAILYQFGLPAGFFKKKMIKFHFDIVN